MMFIAGSDAGDKICDGVVPAMNIMSLNGPAHCA